MHPNERNMVIAALIVSLITGVVGCNPERERPNRRKSKTQHTQSNIQYPDDIRLRPREEIPKLEPREQEPKQEPSVTKTEEIRPQAISSVITPDLSDLTIDKNDTNWISPSELPSEYWEIQYAGERPIGFMHHRVIPSLTGDDSKLRTETKTLIRSTRAGQKLEQKFDIDTIEKFNGELQTVHSELAMGDDVTEMEGNVVKDSVLGTSLRITINKQGRRKSLNIPWKPEYRGPFAIQQSLKRSPLKPDEKRRIKYFDPLMVQVVEASLVAQSFQMSPVLEAVRVELLEVNVFTTLGKNIMESRIWVDQSGNIQKTYTGLLDMRSFRANQEQVLAVRDAGEIDLIQVTSVALNGGIEKSSEATSVTYRISSKLGFDWDRDVPETEFQKVLAKSAIAKEVRVTKARMDTVSTSTQTPPGQEYLQSSGFIQSDDPKVVELANAFIAGDSSAESDAMKLCRGVYSAIAKKDFSKGFLSAAQVAYELQGDCTEHAVLLAAVARARGIPSRVASGLVYSSQEGLPIMAFHMWTELWIGGKWIPADAVSGQFPAPPNRILLSQTALADENPFDDLLKVFHAMGKIQIEILDVRY